MHRAHNGRARARRLLRSTHALLRAAAYSSCALRSGLSTVVDERRRQAGGMRGWRAAHTRSTRAVSHLRAARAAGANSGIIGGHRHQRRIGSVRHQQHRRVKRDGA